MQVGHEYVRRSNTVLREETREKRKMFLSRNNNPLPFFSQVQQLLQIENLCKERREYYGEG